MGPALELSVVDLKSVGADRLGTEVKLKSLGKKILYVHLKLLDSPLGSWEEETKDQGNEERSHP